MDKDSWLIFELPGFSNTDSGTELGSLDALRGASETSYFRGEDALWMAGSTEYDAIVLDVMLPGIDGFETCRRLRADGVWSPVVMLTARDAVEDRIAGLDAGADDYLPKPFSFAELLARVQALPGFGKQKSQIFVALLGKQLGVRPQGWAEVAGDYAEPGSFRSVADVVDGTSLERVRAFKKEKKAAARG